MAIYVDDRELVAAHRAGDSAAFDELVREHRTQLLAHANRKLHCDDAAQDAVQETLVRAYKALPRFNGEYRLGPWLHRIMSNVCVDEAHRRRRDGEKADKFAFQATHLFNAPSAEDELGLNIDDASLREAIEDLPGSHREALVLRFVDELDYEQVAKQAGVSEQNARARVSRARSAVRAAVKGVAVGPVLLFGLLKRGEKAAAAVTASSAVTTTVTTAASQSASATLPALTEATTVITHAGSVAVPLITKAAVGVGLVAAVLTPTSDSAMHQAVSNMGLPEFGQETDVSLTAIDASFIASQSALPAEPSELSIAISDDFSNDGLSRSSLTSSSSLETLTPTIDQSANAANVQTFDDSNRQADVLLPVDRSGQKSTLSVAVLTVAAAGAERYELSGPLSLVAEKGAYAGALQSGSVLRLAPGSKVDELRIEAMLMVQLDDGQTIQIQLAGLAENQGPNLDVSGIYGTSVAGDVALGITGWFSAELNLEGVTDARSLVLNLES